MTKEQWKPLRGSSPTPDQIMLSIKGDPAREMTVRWRVSEDVTNGYALFRPGRAATPCAISSRRIWTAAISFSAI